MTRESTRPERTTSGVRSESKKTLRCKANVFDITMQGRHFFTFKYEGTHHNPRFYAAKVKFSVKLINAPRGPTVGSTGYQMFSRTVSGETTHSAYGPIIIPNSFADFFFEKAVIEVLGRTEIEPSTQTHQITKIIHFYTTTKPEDAFFKYSNLGGYEEDYDSKLTSQLHQVPITIANNGTIATSAGANDKQITQAEFTGGTTGEANADFAYTTKEAAKLADKFNNSQDVQLEVPL